MLTFLHQSDRGVLHPVFSWAHVVRNHGPMVFDMLHGMGIAHRRELMGLTGGSANFQGVRRD